MNVGYSAGMTGYTPRGILWVRTARAGVAAIHE